jgi:L-seryl-tRNA(Ser) seleniumtransferase
VLEDWGSGCIADPAAYGISGEESAAQVLAAEPDAICFSGDKLLGGPQAGIIIGRRELIERMRRNHLYRALRVGKLTLLALEEALRAYLQGRERDIPVLEMLGRDLESLRTRAETIIARVASPRLRAIESDGRVGGGAAPEVVVPSIAIAVEPPAGADALKDALRAGDPPVIARVLDDRVLLDLRTVFADEDDILVKALKESTG